VPQVFFGDKHIGGADETLEILEQWDKDETSSPLEKYREEIESQPDSTDGRLREATEPPVKPKEALPRDEADKIELPDGSSKSVLDLMEQLRPILGGKKKTTVLKVNKNTFSGAEGVADLTKAFSIKEEEAVAFGKVLLEREILQPVGDSPIQEFSNSKSQFFRLQCYHTPSVLNSYRLWNTRVDPDAVGVLFRLKKLMGKIVSAVTNEEGLVDYKKAPETKHWPIFEEAVCELQCCDIGKLDHKTKVAWVINLYNLGIKYSFMKVGIYTDALGLMAYFKQILFNVGGFLFGFHDLESGILRGNRNAPYAFSAPIGKEDPRLALLLSDDKVDCRIHFGLNCGAKSCPPVKNFTAEGIEEELRIVAQAFAEDDGNVTINTKHRVLSLSQIINWYRIDFAPSTKELPQKIVQFLRGEKKEKLQSMIDDGKKIKIKFKPYDWSTDAGDFLAFRKANIQADYTAFMGVC